MNPPSTETPKCTTGKASATIKDSDNEFKNFKGKGFSFYLDESAKKWQVTAIGDESAGVYQTLALRFPNVGNVSGEVYEISNNGADPRTANATWTRASAGSFRPYPAVSGRVTVTLDSTLQTAELKFDFEGENGTKTVRVTEGSMSVEGLTEEKRINTTGSASCVLRDTINAPYQSTTTELYSRPALGIFPPHILAHTQQYAPKPELINYVLNIQIANGLPSGTYLLRPDSKQVRISFQNLNQFTGWFAESGEITLDSIPDFETLQGPLSGTFNFKATAIQSDGTVLKLTADEGIFDITTVALERS
ncbi:hypothetical protein [Pseudomonas khavaziana]|uniref:Uncharacterized protein n=1 Tax=Pseudomonas khavaziana TaxID=2842351 RepID=A0ABZ2DCC0_9PSED